MPQHGLSQYQHLDIAVVSTDSLTWPDVSPITAVCLAVLLLHHFIALSSSISRDGAFLPFPGLSSNRLYPYSRVYGHR